MIDRKAREHGLVMSGDRHRVAQHPHVDVGEGKRELLIMSPSERFQERLEATPGRQLEALLQGLPKERPIGLALQIRERRKREREPDLLRHVTVEMAHAGRNATSVDIHARESVVIQVDERVEEIEGDPANHASARPRIPSPTHRR